MKPTQNNLLGYLLKNLQNSELVERLLRNLQGQQLLTAPFRLKMTRNVGKIERML